MLIYERYWWPTSITVCLHSIDSALLKVQDYVLWVLDRKKRVVHVLLDLPMTFNTVDHSILINRLHKRLGLKHKALNWFKSYLTQRFQCVPVNSTQSDIWELLVGILQSSVLGSILFTIYTLPLGDILSKHNIGYHLYAGKTQIYLRHTCHVMLRILQAEPVRLKLALNGIEKNTTHVNVWKH